MVILTYFCQRASCSATLLTPPPFHSVLLLLQATQAQGEVPSCCGRQSSSVTVRIPISFRSQAAQCAGLVGSQLGLLFALSKWTAGAAPFWAYSQNNSALLHT
jgi:hypothetical protein